MTRTQSGVLWGAPPNHIRTSGLRTSFSEVRPIVLTTGQESAQARGG